jgi:diguanylate cyclase (GGDEF)-like protein
LINSIEYSVAYLDIDNFKAYNDVYGFENGDLVIKLLADILKNHITDEQFIGHVGGDDFVVILNDVVTKEYFEDIVNHFELEALNLYHQVDVKKGYITTENRHGVIEEFPLITLTSVVVNSQMRTFENVYELTEMLARLKKMAKQSKAV